jgi:hypothetical protein
LIILAFSGCAERFHEIAMTENERGKERKTNGRSAISDQVKDGGETKAFTDRKSYNKYLIKKALFPT